MHNRGFTLVETIMVMGIMATFLGIVTVGVLGFQRRASLSEVTNILVSDLQAQQVKAMTGASVSGSVPTGYGIYFEPNRYVLFSGSSYSPSDPANASVSLASPVSISSVGFGGNTVVFLRRSGEILGFVAGADDITIATDNGETKTIRLNRYGVVTLVQ